MQYLNFHMQWIITMAADDPVPYVAEPAAAVVLTM